MQNIYRRKSTATNFQIGQSGAAVEPTGGAADPLSPHHGNTGGSLRQAVESIQEKRTQTSGPEASLPQTTPPPDGGRKTRAKVTTKDMSDFVKLWFFDWLSVTIPNGSNGKGSRDDGISGEKQNDEAAKRLFTWATLQGLHVQRIGKGTDRYFGAAHMAFDPVAKDRVASIRDGHSTNMPNIELTGADGICATLAPRALDELGPTLIARADVSWDVSQEGLFDEIHELLCTMATEHKMEPPRTDGTEEKGRTLYFGAGEASVKVYEKSFELLAKEKIDVADLDANLVRIEFTFRPKKGRKSGLALIAKDQGAGGLLATTRWVRKLTEQVAVVTKTVRESDAQMAVGRVASTPDVRRPQKMAKAAVEQYRRSLCNGAISQIVLDEHDGDWRAAVIDPELVIDNVCHMVRSTISATAYDLVEQHGVMHVKSIEDEADRQQLLLDVWMVEQHKRTDRAKFMLARAARHARDACGVPEPLAA